MWQSVNTSVYNHIWISYNILEMINVSGAQDTSSMSQIFVHQYLLNNIKDEQIFGAFYSLRKHLSVVDINPLGTFWSEMYSGAPEGVDPFITIL